MFIYREVQISFLKSPVKGMDWARWFFQPDCCPSLQDRGANRMDSLSVLIGGKAGDGINEAGMLISRTLNQMGYRVYQYYDYPSLIRGGHNFSLVRAERYPIASHKDSVDILLALNQETVQLHQSRLNKESAIIFDDSQVQAEGMAIPVGRIIKEEAAAPIMRNTCMVGALCRAASIPLEVLEGAVVRHVKKKTELNLRVAGRAYKSAVEKFSLERLDQEPMPIITGNEAIGLGLLRSGLGAYVSYPMTPSSSLLHFLANAGPDFGVKVVHPENEIAVVLMALGFAYAGVRSAVGTSGGGFCLMNEGLSLAGQSEIPLTLLVSQRAGPSTGGPTYTAQSDLHFVINAGQGEFVRLVVAPGDAEEAYFWSGLALDLSWRLQIPAFILSDKTLSESAYCFSLSRAGEPPEQPPERWDFQIPYQRYLRTPSGVSPLAFPGQKGAQIKVNSYAHDQSGLTTEDAFELASMQDKRMRKEAALNEALAEQMTVKSMGHLDSPTALICWGSNKGVCQEVGASFGLRVVQPVVLWPFPASQMGAALEGVEDLICVECNSTGQLARLMECQGLEPGRRILKYDGRPFSTEELAARLKEVV